MTLMDDQAILKATDQLRQTTAHSAATTAADEIYEVVRSLIVAGVLEPGAPLDQHRLAELLGTSRTPLRYALSRLTQDGLVQTKARSVARVAFLSRAEAKELYALRAAIEPLAARTASLAAKPSTIAELRVLNEAMSQAISLRRYDDFVVHDRAFHRQMYAPSPRARTKDFIERLRDASDRYVRAYTMHSADSSTSVEEHTEILHAYEHRELETLSHLITTHVERGARTLLDLID